jgi:glycosyltransferase involved in cell wall biosynthesis
MEASIKSVAFVAPGWPPERAPSGIVTYVNNVAGALSDIDVASHILSLEHVEPSFRRFDVVDLSEYQKAQTQLLTRIVHRVRRNVDPMTEFARRKGRAITWGLNLLKQPDILEVEESHGFANWIQAGKVPVVVRLHGPWFINGPASDRQGEAGYARRCSNELQAISGATGISAPSRSVLDKTLAKLDQTPACFEVIPNPTPAVPPERQWSLQNSAPHKMLYVGRFERLKGPDVVLKAFVRIKRELPNAILYFVGPDLGFKDDAGKTWSIPEYLDARIPPDIRPGIAVLGIQTAAQIEKLRRECRVAIVSSRQENFPLAVAESLCMGSPTVATNVGGIPELIRDEVEGLLFCTEDDNHLALQVLRVMKNDQLAQALGANALLKSAQLSPAVIADQTLRFYERVLRHSQR